MQRFLLFLFLSPAILLAGARSNNEHQHHSSEHRNGDYDVEEVDDEDCLLAGGVRLSAEYAAGVVTVDGIADEWDYVTGSNLPMLPAEEPDDTDEIYPNGKMTLKALHDGNNAYFLLKVDGNYVYSKGDDYKCPSVALMFQVGINATYSNMGGCRKYGAECNSISCEGHEVDIMHFSIGSAIPGRLYGGNLMDNQEANGNDRFGHLVDAYAWNPHCLFFDGKGPLGNDSSARNDWQGAWWHSSFTKNAGFIEKDSPYSTDGQKGSYFFEFSRPLRTMDKVQQDVQFTIGQTSKMAVAFWYPSEGNPWKKSDHYSVSCDWIPLDFIASSSIYSTPNGNWDATTTFSMLLSVAALGVSIFVAYWASKNRFLPFTPVDRL